MKKCNPSTQPIFADSNIDKLFNMGILLACLVLPALILFASLPKY